MNIAKRARAGLQRHAAALIVFAALTIIVTYPVVTQIATHLAQDGECCADAYHHSYVFWWYGQALRDGQQPANLTLVEYPNGGSYPMLHAFSAVYLPGLPLLPFLSPTAVYNITFLLTFFLSGVFMYLWVTYLTGSRCAGIIAGVVYAFFPSRMAHAFAGHPEHIALYSFPLYLLLLTRMLREPRWRTALACSLALAWSLLVQPMYIPFLLVPATVVVLIAELSRRGHRLERRTMWMLLAIAGLATLATAPVFVPIVAQQADQGADSLEDSGIVQFSADLLGAISPSPLNPFYRVVNLTPDYAAKTVVTDYAIAETHTYAGLFGLGLACLALLVARRKALPWVILAAGAWVLTLGPILKAGGNVVKFTADTVSSTVALPYALLMKLPFISYNRAPSRVVMTMMLAIAVLDGFAVAWLLERLKRNWMRGFATAAIAAAILIDFTVTWPFPTTELSAPAVFETMADDPDAGPVLTYPLTRRAQAISLYQQTIHHQPIFAGWTQRVLGSELNNPSVFLDDLLTIPPPLDIVPAVYAGTIAAITEAQDVRYVVLHSDQLPNAGDYLAYFTGIFGDPVSQESEVLVFEQPHQVTGSEAISYVLRNKRWYGVEIWEGAPGRWMNGEGELFIYSPYTQTGVLSFKAAPIDASQRLAITVNDAPVTTLMVSDFITYTTPAFELKPGRNLITFAPQEACTAFKGDPRCSGTSRNAGSECNAYLEVERCLTVLVQHPRFSASELAFAAEPVNITLADQVRLAAYAVEDREPASGETLHVTLYWESLQSMAQDTVMFVHLLKSDGNLAAQYDAAPLLNPTSTWLPGDVFTFHAELALPRDLPTGAYDLFTGMYTYPDLQRLPVAADRPGATDGLVWLETLTVTYEGQ